MSIEKRDGKYLARWRDPDGRQRAKRFATRQEAKDHLTHVESDKLRGVYSARRGAPVLKIVADEWLAASPHLSPVTAKTYRRDLDGYILPTFGKMRADKIDARAIQRWIGAELKPPKPLKPITVHRHFRTLRTLLNHARRMGYIATNPCDDVNPPKVSRNDVKVLTVDQVNAIAANIDERYRALVLVAAYGGLRWGEAIGLRRMDVDGPKVTIAGQLQRIDGKWERLEPKWASRRTVTLPASVARQLAAHIEKFAKDEPTALIFTNTRGNPIGDSFRGNVWGPACAAAGLGKLEWVKPSERGPKGRYGYWRKITGAPRFHDLRHTAASLAIATGAHPKAIQARLGHSTIAMTMDLYGHLMEGMDAQLAADLETLTTIGED